VVALLLCSALSPVFQLEQFATTPYVLILLFSFAVVDEAYEAQGSYAGVDLSGKKCL
jgi:hypothetical protein